MGIDDPKRRLKRLLELAELAASPAESEARNAAILACEILRAHKEHVAFTDIGAMASGKVHHLAALFKSRGIVPNKVVAAPWCLACGDAIEHGAPSAHHARAGDTHYKCRAWWADFDFASLLPDPF